MIKLPKYKTIEIKEFPLIFEHSEPIFEYKAYSFAKNNREKQIREYAISKVGTKYEILNLPKRLVINNQTLTSYSISIEYTFYSQDNTSRVLISKPDFDDLIVVVYQISTN